MQSSQLAPPQAFYKKQKFKPKTFRIFLDSVGGFQTTTGNFDLFTWNVNLPINARNGRMYVENLCYRTGATGTPGIAIVRIDPFNHPLSFDTSTKSSTNVVLCGPITLNQVYSYQIPIMQGANTPLPSQMPTNFPISLSIEQVSLTGAKSPISRVTCMLCIIEEDPDE